MIKQYVKKPIPISAMQFTGKNPNELIDFVTDRYVGFNAEREMYFIRTLEGDMYITNGDYIIQGVYGEYYPCKEEIFLKTYEEVTERDGVIQ